MSGRFLDHGEVGEEEAPTLNPVGQGALWVATGDIGRCPDRSRTSRWPAPCRATRRGSPNTRRQVQRARTRPPRRPSTTRPARAADSLATSGSTSWMPNLAMPQTNRSGSRGRPSPSAPSPRHAFSASSAAGAGRTAGSAPTASATTHIIHPDEPAAADRARFDLVAPYERDPARWTSVQWADAESGRPHRIATSPFGGAEAIRVKSIRDIVTLYRRKREAKSLGPDGTVCARETVGLLRRRPVRDLTIRHIGKEANEVEDLVAGLAAADDVTQTLVHKGRGIYPQLILPALNVVPETRLAEISGVPRRTIDGLRAGRRPTRRVARLVGDALEQLSRESVVADPAPPAMAALAAWRDTGYAVACLQCSQPIVPARRRYCSNRCRQAAYRHG